MQNLYFKAGLGKFGEEALHPWLILVKGSTSFVSAILFSTSAFSLVISSSRGRLSFVRPSTSALRLLTCLSNSSFCSLLHQRKVGLAEKAGELWGQVCIVSARTFFHAISPSSSTLNAQLGQQKSSSPEAGIALFDHVEVGLALPALPE